MSISVIIPSYNRADLLPRTIGSIAKQTLLPEEVVVVDDESSDNTHDVVEGLKTQYPNIQITFIRHEKNKGEAGARNTGIKNASGEYLAFLDSDDEWINEKLELQLAYMEANNVDGVFCEYYQVSDGKYDGAEHVKIKPKKIIRKDLMTRGCGYGVGTNLMIKSKAVKEVLFDEELRLFTDLDWLYRVTESAEIGVLHTPLSYYHKAPMRQGDYIAKRVDIFYKKYKAQMSNWSVFYRLKVKSQMNWYIANAYKGNQNYRQAAKYLAFGILQSPIRHPGHYVECLRCFVDGFFNRKKII